MKRNHTYFILILVTLMLNACGKDVMEPYDHPFIHIMKDNLSTTTVAWNVNAVNTYSVYLSSKPLKEKLTVDFDIIVGNGLQEGVDYEIINKSRSLLFLPGIYDMPIRIKWLPNPIDPTKDNTIKIVLLSNSMNLTIGMPGPDHLQSEFTITKTK